MSAVRLALTLALAAWLASGCAALDKINPFSSSAPKLPELKPITPTVDLRQAWSASLGKSGEFALTPAVIGSSVYAADRSGTLSRVDGGRQVWKIDVGVPISGGVGGDAQMVIVGSPKGDVVAVSSEGKVLWKSRVSSEVLAPPTIAEGVVIVRSSDSRLHGLDVTDGKRKWSYQRATPALSLRSFGGVVIVGKAALAGFPGGKLIAVSLNNGGLMWEATVALPKGATELERVADVTSAPILGPKQVCAVAYQGRSGCFDPGSGNALWTRDISSAVGMDTDGRYVFVTDERGAIHALDINTGASVWKQDKLAQRNPTRPLVVGSYVVVADSKGNVHVLNRDDGNFAARVSSDSSGVRAEPQRLSDSSFVVQVVGGGLYAYSLR